MSLEAVSVQWVRRSIHAAVSVSASSAFCLIPTEALRSERCGQQGAERCFAALPAVTDTDYECIRAKFVDDLPACAARRRGGLRGSIDRDRLDFFFTRRDRLEDGGALRAIAEAERCVLDVASGKYFSRFRQDGGPDTKIRIRAVRMSRSATGGFFQRPKGGAGDFHGSMVRRSGRRATRESED